MLAITSSTLPDVARTDIARVIVERWIAPDPVLQHEVANAALKAWADCSLPPSLASVSCFTSSRGDITLTFEQWTDRGARPSALGPVTVGAEVEHHEPVEYVPYRSIPAGSDSSGAVAGAHDPGCVVLVTFDFDSAERSREWADLLIAAIDGQESPTVGCRSAAT